MFRQALRCGVVMARKDHETIDRLIGLATAAVGGNKRRAARLLFDGFQAIVTDSTTRDQRWGSEICGNASVRVYTYPDEVEDTAERPVHCAAEVAFQRLALVQNARVAKTDATAVRTMPPTNFTVR
jgi:hypothetical protein